VSSFVDCVKKGEIDWIINKGSKAILAQQHQQR